MEDGEVEVVLGPSNTVHVHEGPSDLVQHQRPHLATVDKLREPNWSASTESATHSRQLAVATLRGRTSGAAFAFS